LRIRNLALMTLPFMMVLSVFAIRPAMAPVEPRMYVDPVTVSVNVNDEFTVDIMIADVNLLYAWQFRLAWNPDPFLDYVTTIQGDFLTSQGASTLFGATNHEEEGYIDVVCTAKGSFPGANGNGWLATVKFVALDIGSSELDLKNTKLIKAYVPPAPPEAIPHVAEDGFVDVQTDLLSSPNFYVELVEKKVSSRHWDISVKGNELIFYGKGKNRADIPLWCRIVFAGMKDGEDFSVVTDMLLLEPGENSPPFQTYTMYVDPGFDVGTYNLNVYAEFSYMGYKWYSDLHKVKDLSFVIEP